MLRKVIRSAVVIAALVAGTTVITEAPAFANGVCATDYQPLGPCVDYSGGNYVRADFYLNDPPSTFLHGYRVGIVVNNHLTWLTLRTDFKATGRYCCWYRETDTMPPSWKKAYTRVDIYNSSGVVVKTVASPTIDVYN